MRILSLLFLFCCLSASLWAQLPPVSPKAELRQQVGNTFITLEYARPIARGRQIFGGQVPYGQQWQTGAEATFIRFDQPVTIAGQELPAGGYALITIPDKTEWTIMIHDAANGSMRYDKSTYKVQTCVPVTKPNRFYEALSLEFDVMQHSARLYITWTDVQVSIPIETQSEQSATAYINNLLKSSTSYVEEDHFRAVNFLLFNKLEPEKAVSLIQRIQRDNPAEYPYRQLVRAYLQLGKKEAALKALDEGRAALRREYADDPETLNAFLEGYTEQRAKIVAGTADGQRAW